mmetsp:Transcript_6801/g.18824  ORF Transcript_6801/g.18824 Transcript_6801/m.18824 type:complete len:237 (+) Transcript_6801:2356-3066(+)
MAPSAATRPAFLSAEARPFFLRKSLAASISLLFSARAFLQSIMPAPDAARSSLTSLADTSTLGASDAFSSSFGASSFFSAAFAAMALDWASTSAAKSSSFLAMPSPRLYRSKRLTWMFSPISAIAALITSATVFEVSLTNGCSRRAISLAILSRRPWTICPRMFSGLEAKSSFSISMALSFSSISLLTSSTDTTLTPGQAAICMAISLTSSWNFSPRPTKSVSQLTSTSTPSFAPA